MPYRRHLGPKSLGSDNYSEVCFLGRATLHGLVVGVLVRVVVNFESGRLEGRELRSYLVDIHVVQVNVGAAIAYFCSYGILHRC